MLLKLVEVKRKGWLVFLIGFWLLLTQITPVGAAQETTSFLNIAEMLDYSQLENFLSTLDMEKQQLLPNLSPETWGANGPQWELGRIIQGAANYFLREVIFNLKNLGQLIIIAVLLAFLQNIKNAFASETISNLAFGVCFLIIMGLVINSFGVTVTIAEKAVTEMGRFMYAILPLLFSLIAAAGGATTVAIVHPLLITSVGIISGVICKLIFPLLLIAGVLGLVNFLIDGFKIDKLAGLLKTCSLWLLGFAMALFIGVVSIKGFAATVADSTALRTAKYFSNTFLPVVGGEISDTLEMAINCSQVVKNGLGIYGLIVISVITLFPLIKILAIGLVYQLAGAIVQPLGSIKIADALQTVSKTVLNIFGALAVVSLMFFISISILVGVARI